MRESQYRILKEKLQHKLNNAAKIIQQWMRAKLERKRYLQLRKAAITIQVKITNFQLFIHLKTLNITHGSLFLILYRILVPERETISLLVLFCKVYLVRSLVSKGNVQFLQQGVT